MIGRAGLGLMSEQTGPVRVVGRDGEEQAVFVKYRGRGFGVGVCNPRDGYVVEVDDVDLHRWFRVRASAVWRIMQVRLVWVDTEVVVALIPVPALHPRQLDPVPTLNALSRSSFLQRPRYYKLCQASSLKVSRFDYQWCGRQTGYANDSSVQSQSRLTHQVPNSVMNRNHVIDATIHTHTARKFGLSVYVVKSQPGHRGRARFSVVDMKNAGPGAIFALTIRPSDQMNGVKYERMESTADIVCHDPHIQFRTDMCWTLLERRLCKTLMPCPTGQDAMSRLQNMLVFFGAPRMRCSLLLTHVIIVCMRRATIY